MKTRIIPLVVWIPLVAACGAEGKGVARADAAVRFDTAAGFRLGMLLPEARAAANARGEDLQCEPAWTGPPRPDMADSIYQHLLQVQNCDPGHLESYRLQFHQGSLRTISVALSDDWEMIPVDTLVARLAQRYGEPSGHDRYGAAGQREQLIWWFRKGHPATLGVRCPDPSLAADCELEYRL